MDIASVACWTQPSNVPGSIRSGSGRRFLHPRNFFLFLVERNSANFAPRRPRKSFADDWLASGSGAKLPEFRSGGGAKLKLSPGGAFKERRARSEERSAGTASAPVARPRSGQPQLVFLVFCRRCAKLLPRGFAHLRELPTVELTRQGSGSRIKGQAPPSPARTTNRRRLAANYQRAGAQSRRER